MNGNAGWLKIIVLIYWSSQKHLQHQRSWDHRQSLVRGDVYGILPSSQPQSNFAYRLLFIDRLKPHAMVCMPSLSRNSQVRWRSTQQMNRDSYAQYLLLSNNFCRESWSTITFDILSCPLRACARMGETDRFCSVEYRAPSICLSGTVRPPLRLRC